MSHEIAVYGVGISVIFAFLPWAMPIMPKPVAWSGVLAGAIIFLQDALMPQINVTLSAIGLFLIGLLCIGGAIHLSLVPKATSAVPVATTPATNRMGDVRDNKGIVTQGQEGDNAIRTK
jgi:hypothetical protein